MKENQTRIEFTADDGSSTAFFVIEQIRIAGIDYLLVADKEEGEDSEAYILKEVREEDGQSIYEMIEEESELEAISKVFEETIGDVEIEI